MVMDFAHAVTRRVMMVMMLDHTRTAMVVHVVVTAVGQYVGDDRAGHRTGDKHAHTVVMRVCRLGREGDRSQGPGNDQKLSHLLPPWVVTSEASVPWTDGAMGYGL